MFEILANCGVYARISSAGSIRGMFSIGQSGMWLLVLCWAARMEKSGDGKRHMSTREDYIEPRAHEE